jgi:hypothetical protein
MTYFKNDKYVIEIAEIKSAFYDKLAHGEKIWDIVQVNYKDGSVIQMPYENEEKAKAGFEEIAGFLVGNHV